MRQKKYLSIHVPKRTRRPPLGQPYQYQEVLSGITRTLTVTRYHNEIPQLDIDGDAHVRADAIVDGRRVLVDFVLPQTGRARIVNTGVTLDTGSKNG